MHMATVVRTPSRKEQPYCYNNKLEYTFIIN